MNTKKPLTLICVQPCIPYYAWQLEVMLTNFTELNIHQVYDIHILCAYNEKDTDWEKKKEPMHKVEEKYRGKASFFFYHDTRVFPITYISGLRPNLLKQHYEKKRDLIADTVFYHDCDIVFTRFPDFLENYIGKKDWYVSDTRSYIGYNYIISKGDDVFSLMTDIVDIPKELVQSKQDQSGGCQYIMNSVDAAFFEKMENDCEEMFKVITNINNQIKSHVNLISKQFIGKPCKQSSNEERAALLKEILDACNQHLLTAISIKPQIKSLNLQIEDDCLKSVSYHELQIWCADMWAILWGAWKRGYNTHIIPELTFTWATDLIKAWDDRYIFHNAGITNSMKETHFYKGDYREKYPYEIDGSKYDASKASYKYFELIQSIGKNSCLL